MLDNKLQNYIFQDLKPDWEKKTNKLWFGLSVVGVSLHDVFMDVFKYPCKIIAPYFLGSSIYDPPRYIEPKIRANVTKEFKSLLTELVKCAASAAASPFKLAYQIVAVATDKNASSIVNFDHTKPFKGATFKGYTRPKTVWGRIDSIRMHLLSKVEKTGYYGKELLSSLTFKDAIKNGETALAGIGEIALSVLFSPIEAVYELTHPWTPQDESAAKIQKTFHGYIARKSFLPKDLYPEYKGLCEKLKNKDNETPMAKGGRHPVYLPDSMPGVVVKWLGKKGLTSRFQKILAAQRILRREGCTKLIVPQVRKYQEFLIETRLPININPYYNMKEYLSDPKKYDQAAREMTRFYSRAYLTDIFGDRTLRYDNLPFFDGNIGLIDLEHLHFQGEKARLDEYELDTLAYIFPLNLDVILDEARKLGVKSVAPSVAKTAEKRGKFLELRYTKYCAWLKDRGITASSPNAIEISPMRQAELKKVLESELNGDKETAEKALDAILSILNKLASYSKGEASSVEALMEKRTLLFSGTVNDIMHNRYALWEHLRSETVTFDLFTKLFAKVMEELKGKEVYHFDQLPSVYIELIY